MEIDRLSPYILRGKIYVKEAGESLPFFSEGFNGLILNTAICNREVYIQILGFSTFITYLIPTLFCSDCIHSDKFVLRTDEFIYFYNMNKKDFHFHTKPPKEIRLTYFQPPYFDTLCFMPDIQLYRSGFKHHTVGPRPEDSNLFIFRKGNETYLILIL